MLLRIYLSSLCVAEEQRNAGQASYYLLSLYQKIETGLAGVHLRVDQLDVRFKELNSTMDRMDRRLDRIESYAARIPEIEAGVSAPRRRLPGSKFASIRCMARSRNWRRAWTVWTRSTSRLRPP